jgi:hypothetical protein
MDYVNREHKVNLDDDEEDKDEGQDDEEDDDTLFDNATALGGGVNEDVHPSDLQPVDLTEEEAIKWPSPREITSR